MNATCHHRNMIEVYYYLIENLSDEDKIELIARISNSILKQKADIKLKAKEKILKETYGSFQSSSTADEIIDEIYKSRYLSSIKIENWAQNLDI